MSFCICPQEGGRMQDRGFYLHVYLFIFNYSNSFTVKKHILTQGNQIKNKFKEIVENKTINLNQN